MNNNSILAGKTVAILATHGFEEAELFEPKKALEKAGAEVKIVSLSSGKITGWKNGDWSKSISVDDVLDEVYPEHYDAIMLPGGVINADTMRENKSVIDFMTQFAETGKPIAAICHAPWILIETGLCEGRQMTSWSSLKTDLINAGASWSDTEVLVDRGWVTSRKPADIPAFNEKMIEEFAEGPHEVHRLKPSAQIQKSAVSSRL